LGQYGELTGEKGDKVVQKVEKKNLKKNDYYYCCYFCFVLDFFRG
jgi:hypothetical protein